MSISILSPTSVTVSVIVSGRIRSMKKCRWAASKALIVLNTAEDIWISFLSGDNLFAEPIIEQKVLGLLCRCDSSIRVVKHLVNAQIQIFAWKLTQNTSFTVFRNEGRRFRFLSDLHGGSSRFAGNIRKDLPVADQRRSGYMSGGLAGARPPLPALSPTPHGNARLIGIVFFQEVERSGIEADALHQCAGRKAILQKFIRREEGEGLSVAGQGRQAGTTQMKLRKAFFAPAPKAQSFSYVVQNLRGNGVPVSRSEQGENARPLVILGQRPLAGSRPREQGAGAEHEPLARHFQIGSK